MMKLSWKRRFKISTFVFIMGVVSGWLAVPCLTFSQVKSVQGLQKKTLQNKQVVAKPVITSVRPSKITLVVGGDAAIIVVNGNNLHLVKSAQLVKNNRAVSSVPVALDQSWPKVKKVALKTSSMTLRSGRYQLRFFDANKRPIKDVTLSISVRASVQSQKFTAKKRCLKVLLEG